MKISQIAEITGAKVLTGENQLSCEVNAACGCDLMSDVLRYVQDDIILITGLTNVHTIHTAEMALINYILFVRGKSPAPEVIEAAEEAGITVLRTDMPMYEACGLLFQNGLGAKR